MNIVEQSARMFNGDNPCIMDWLMRHRHQGGKLLEIQVGLNAPLLLAAIDDLYQQVIDDGIQKVLFQARDGCLMLPLWRKIHPDIEATYFYASRDCWRTASDGFRAYYERESTGKTCLVDFISAGKSMVVAAKLGMDIRRVHTVMFMDWLADPPLPGKYSWSVTMSSTPVYCSGPEMLNYDVMPQVMDVSASGVPVLSSEVEYDMKQVDAMHKAFMDMLDDAPVCRIKNASFSVHGAFREIDRHRQFLDQCFPGHVVMEKARLSKWGAM